MLNRAIPIVASLGLLCGVAAERLSLQPPPSAVKYHAHVRQLAKSVPMRFGAWVGQDIPVPADARKMLHPNVAITRRYRNMSTGLEVSFLFVQCEDALHIVDHYPPICYVGEGYSKDSANPMDWKAGALQVKGTEYEFSRGELGRPTSAMTVDNFIVMPGAIERDMEAAKIAAADLRRRYFGAAQVQVVFPRGLPREERAAVFEAFVGICEPLVTAVESGLAN